VSPRISFRRLSDGALQVSRGDQVFLVSPHWEEIKANQHYETMATINGENAVKIAHLTKIAKASSDAVQRFTCQHGYVVSKVLPNFYEVARWILDNVVWPVGEEPLPAGAFVAAALDPPVPNRGIDEPEAVIP
jgi:hypothetical protein